MKKALALLLALAMTASFAFTGCGSEEEGTSTEGNTETTEGTTTEGTETSDAAASGSSKGVKSSEISGSILMWNVGADSKTLDPTLNSTVDGGHVIFNTFEGLMRDKSDGNGSQPAMAEAEPTIVENEDGTVTYTFTLRDAKWSDGQPVKAQDFVFSWQRAVDPMTASEYAYIMSPILNADEITAGEKDKSELGVKAVDGKTLEVTLKQPCGYFEQLLDFPTYMPLREDIIGADTDGLWAKDPDKSISNGPFTLVGYTMGQEFVLAKNENYWNAENVKIDYIVAQMISDQSTCLTAFNNGELYIGDNCVPNEEIQQLVAAGSLQIMPYIGTSFFVINAQTEIEALQDQKVRQALSMAIDRKSIVENVTGAGEKVALGYVPYGFTDADGNDFRETAGNYYLAETAQVEAAQALLAEAGYPNGEGIPQLEIVYNTSDSLKALAEAIQEMWKTNLGIDVKLSNQEWAVFQDTRQNLTYSSIARHGWVGDYLDPQTFLDMFVTGNLQSGNGYSNTEYDKAIETALSSSGKERYDAFYQAEEILMNDAYIIPLYFNVNKVLVNNEKVTGWTLSPMGKFWFGDAEVIA